MDAKLSYARFPLDFKAEGGLVVGYANKAIVDDGRDLIPAEVWLEALQTFFREGTPVKLLHRPNLIAGETVWLKVVGDGLILASRPYPEVRPLIEKGWLKAYSIGFVPKEVEYTPEGVRVIRSLDLYEVSYVDEPMNPGCYFDMVKMNVNHEVIFDRERGVITILGVTPEEMAALAAGLKDLLLKAGVPEDAPLTAIEFKARAPEKAAPAPEETASTSEAAASEDEEASDEELASVDWNEVFTIYYDENAPEEKARWSRRFINRLPDSSFAVIEPAYERGETRDKNCRHLPHHGPGGGGTRNVNLDLPHLRNAFARAPLIKPVTDSISTEELRRRAMEHLEHHRSALTSYQEERASLVERVEELKQGLMGTLRTEFQEELTAVKGKLGETEKTLKELNTALENQGKEIAELKKALATLIDVVQSIVPPPRATPVLDPTAGKRNKSKWGIFER